MQDGNGLIGTSDEPSMSPSASPTNLFASNFVDVLLFVSGLCNGCCDSLTLSNQVSNGRQLFLDFSEDVPGTRAMLGEEAISNCFCPLNSVIEEQQPLNTDLAQSIQLGLQEQKLSLKLEEFGEVNVVERLLDSKSFNSEFTVSVPFFSNITLLDSDEFAGVVNQLAASVEDTYNALAEDYCDPIFKRIQELAFASPSKLQPTTVNKMGLLV
jgi:hypothetical protein